jgi:hypothetical protein
MLQEMSLPPPVSPTGTVRNVYSTTEKHRRPYSTTFLERETPYGTTDDVSRPYRARTTRFPWILKMNEAKKGGRGAPKLTVSFS